MPYTIVLTPSADRGAHYVKAARTFFGDCHPEYLLAHDGTSSPHITVVQFDCSAELAERVWARVCEKQFPPFHPLFVGVAFLEGVGSDANTTWVELSAQRGEANSPIMNVHQAALEALREFQLKPLNAVGNNYRPHLTLARIRMPEQLRSWPKSLIEQPGPFNLEFGMSDEKWQYVKTIRVYERE